MDTNDATLVIKTDQVVEADQSRLWQLFENLIQNAVEHGGDDVTITIGDLASGFFVEEDGHGISTDEQENIFTPGYSTARDGTGFGLSIVDQIAKGHDLEIQMTDGEEGGARFEITGVTVI